MIDPRRLMVVLAEYQKKMPLVLHRSRNRLRLSWLCCRMWRGRWSGIRIQSSVVQVNACSDRTIDRSRRISDGHRGTLDCDRRSSRASTTEIDLVAPTSYLLDGPGRQLTDSA